MNPARRSKLADKSTRGAEYLLFLFAFSSFSIFLAQVGLYLSAFLWLCGALLAGRPRLRRTPLDWPIALLATVTLLSSLAALDISFHLPGLLKTLGLMLVFFWAYYNLRNDSITKTALIAFYLGASLNAAYAVIGYIYHVARNGDWTRGSGTHSIPQTFSEILAMGYVLLFALLLYIPALRRRRWIVLPLALWPLALFVSQTRGAWLGLVAGLLVVGCIANLRKTISIALAAALALGIAGLAWHSIIGEDSVGHYTDRLTHFFDPTWGSNRTRVMIWQAGLKMIEDYPLGVGIDNVYELYPKYKIPGTPQGTFGHLHNNFLQVTAERGWLGLLAFTLLLSRIVQLLLRQIRSAASRLQSGLALGALGATLAFVVSGLTEYTYGDFEVVMVFWFILALGLRQRSPSRKGRNV